MRRFMLGCVLSAVVLLPTIGTAQVFLRPNPYPAATAATAAWQQRGDPVFHAGAFYYPTGPSVYFDGYVMARTGTYEGVAIFEDSTQTPFTIVYVPIGGNVVRPYERVRDGELAGTVGSRPPSFPIRREGEGTVEPAVGPNGGVTTAVDGFVPIVPEAPAPVGTAGVVVAPVVRPAAPVARPAGRSAPTVFEVWVPYEGARWVSAGSAVPYTVERFVQVGERSGLPVYRLRDGSSNQIYIPSVAGGPLAPYAKK